MSLSNLLFAIGWIFSALSTIYAILLTSLGEEWVKHPIIEKLVSTPINTFIVLVFFIIISTLSFILSNHIENVEDKKKIEIIRPELVNSISDLSIQPDINMLSEKLERKGIKKEKFLKMLENGTPTDQGLKLLFEKKYDEAIEKFKEATKESNEEDYGFNWLNIGNAYFFNGDFEDASNAYQKATESNPNLKAAWHNWGASLLKQRFFDKAIEKFQHVEKLDHSDYVNLTTWGCTLLEQGKFEDSIQKFEQAIKLNPKACKTYYNWGLALGRMKKYKESAEKYQDAVDICPKYSSAWSNLGWCFEKLGEYEKSIDKYQKSLDIRPNHAKTLSNMGWSLVKLNRYPEALGHFEKASKYDMSLDDNWYRWGWTLSELKKHDDAIEKYRNAVIANPENIAAWINMCEELSNYISLESADKTFKEASEKIPYSSILWLNWGNLLLRKGDIEEAIKKYEKASNLNPDFSPIWSNMSFALVLIGKPEEALSKIEKAISLDPNNVEALMNYGYLLESLGKKEDAIRSFEKAKHLGGEISSNADQEGVIQVELKSLTLDDEGLEKLTTKVKKDIKGDVFKGAQPKVKNEKQQKETFTYRPYITFAPKKNNEGNYLTVEKQNNIAKILIELELKNTGNVAAKNIRFPDEVNIQTKMDVQRIEKLTPILTLVPDDSVVLGVSMIINYKNEEGLISDLALMNSSEFNGYHFGCTIIYENENGAGKYALSVLYIIKKNRVMVLKINDLNF
jgi:tetratricopeptide (TPR) repeat protein